MILKLLRLVMVNDCLIYYIYNLFPVIFYYKKEKGDFDGL